jgi:hypothetical protein
MKTTIYKYIAWLGALPLLIAGSAKAVVCPICTVAVIGGVGLTRWLKIDDTVTGLWIGGVLVALISWTINWCDSRKINFWARNISIIIAYYLITLIPLYYYEIIGHPLNLIWGIDKLMLGTVVGSIFFYAAHLRYEIYKREHGKALFAFQKIVWPVGTLIGLSLIFWLITRQW